MEPELSFPHSQAPTSCPILSRRNTVHAFPSHVLQIHFNIILPSTLRSCKLPFFIRYPHQKPLYTSPVPRTSDVFLPGSEKIFRVGSFAETGTQYVRCSILIRIILQKTLYVYAYNCILQWIMVCVTYAKFTEVSHCL